MTTTMECLRNNNVRLSYSRYRSLAVGMRGGVLTGSTLHFAQGGAPWESWRLLCEP